MLEDPPYVIYLDRPFEAPYAGGGTYDVSGYQLELAAEVLNLERSVVVTGDHAFFDESKGGLHTMLAFGGVMQFTYSRVEWCGKRGVLGRYCLVRWSGRRFSFSLSLSPPLSPSLFPLSCVPADPLYVY